MLRVVVVLVHDFRQAKVGDFDVTANVAVAEQNVARFQVVMDHGRFDLVQILQGGHDLSNDGPAKRKTDCDD